MNALQIPWETVNIKGVWVIRQVDGWTIAETPGASAVEKENALLIVRAVNSHERFLTFATAFLTECNRHKSEAIPGFAELAKYARRLLQEVKS